MQYEFDYPLISKAGIWKNLRYFKAVRRQQLPSQFVILLMSSHMIQHCTRVFCTDKKRTYWTWNVDRLIGKKVVVITIHYMVIRNSLFRHFISWKIMSGYTWTITLQAIRCYTHANELHLWIRFLNAQNSYITKLAEVDGVPINFFKKCCL